MDAIRKAMRRSGVVRFGTSIECKACGEAWPGRDPALQVACPRCAAGPGEGCRWSGPHGGTTHIARDVAAMQTGHMTACEALTWDGRHSRHAVRICLPSMPRPGPALAGQATLF